MESQIISYIKICSYLFNANIKWIICLLLLGCLCLLTIFFFSFHFPFDVSSLFLRLPVFLLAETPGYILHIFFCLFNKEIYYFCFHFQIQSQVGSRVASECTDSCSCRSHSSRIAIFIAMLRENHRRKPVKKRNLLYLFV